jgi:hypothetical protein
MFARAQSFHHPVMQMMAWSIVASPAASVDPINTTKEQSEHFRVLRAQVLRAQTCGCNSCTSVSRSTKMASYILEEKFWRRSASSRLQVLPNLDVLKIHGRRVSSLELSGLKNLRGVLKRVTLTGSCTYAWRVLLSRELFIHLEIFGFPLDDKNCSYWGPAPDYGSDDKDWPGIESHEIDEGPGSLTSVW